MKSSATHHPEDCCAQAVRDNGRIAVRDEEYAQHLWKVSGLQPALAGITVDGANACGLNPDIRIYRSNATPCPQQCTPHLLNNFACVCARRVSCPCCESSLSPSVTLCSSWRCRYLPGQRFNRHYDDCIDIGGGAKTAYTLLVYLSGKDSGLQGGETVFYGESYPVTQTVTRGHLFSEMQLCALAVMCAAAAAAVPLLCRKEGQDSGQCMPRGRPCAATQAWG